MNAHKFLTRASLISAGCTILFPFLHFYSVNNTNEFFSERVFLAFSLVSIAALGLLLGASLLIGTRLFRIPIYCIAALFSTALVLFFMFKPIHWMAASMLTALGVSTGAMVIYAVVFIVTLLAVSRLARCTPFHLATLVFAAVMVVASGARLASTFATALPQQSDESAAETQRPAIRANGRAAYRLPNVYYVITDGYASLKVLKDQMGFEDANAHRLSAEYGFTHIPDATSSYTATYLTLASIFQGDYPVVEASPRYGDVSGFYPSMLLKSEEPATVTLAKRLGYQFYVVGNNWGDCRGDHVQCLADPGTPYIALPYELRLFIEPTPLAWVLNRYGHLFEGARTAVGIDAIGKVLANFQAGKAPDGPYFMFVHHLPPHPPYMFQADCSPRGAFDFDFGSWSKSAQPFYLANVQCTNAKLLELAAYLAARDPEAIVVFQADHGSAFTVDPSAPINAWSEEAIRERTSIFSMIRVPSRCGKWLKPDMNSVNTVRFVLGCAAREEPRFVENRSYIVQYNKRYADYGKVYRARLSNGPRS